MAFPIMFVWFLIAIFIFQHHLRKSSKATDKATKTFWDKEASSLVVRKKDLEEKDYYQPTIDPDTLVDQAYFDALGVPQLFRLQKYLRKLLSLKMVNFADLTNTDLRLMFGTAMFPTIEAYEDNYTNYIKTLYDLGKGLVEAEDYQLSRYYLEECINAKSDARSHYLLLAKIYDHTNDRKALETLLEKAKALNSLTKNVLVKDLESTYQLSIEPPIEALSDPKDSDSNSID